MSNIILVHGTYAGGFMWNTVAALLREKGHAVWTPTLTGVGERTHLRGPHVGLQTHITDIENVLYYDDITDAVILGFSYGGMVLAGLGRDAVERVRSGILLDAALPEDGESMHDVYAHVGTDTLPPEVAELHAQPEKPLDAPDLQVPPWAAGNPRFSPMPINCHWDRVKLGPLFTSRPNTYIEATRWSMNRRCAERAAALGWTVVGVDSEHGVMDSDPQGLSELIDRSARETRPNVADVA
ncbi:esterase [Pseudoclavibacter endophyticus]|uniref:Alpha/beta fold hydrolase n=1 Tax=Pseudoclavibacter endophyticus TaxID=1778590 RepID=A0A6H9WRH9_9MICO|nr:alpha/beta hydrolase family protein [Pseudoclavibacter endophyticus]KAB1649375.1 alpha/beta fold hydrolase [Pseudoclavibacter endophyticus]GGA63115.1 esterase [Pseudoclavibacter endophyticus]